MRLRGSTRSKIAILTVLVFMMSMVFNVLPTYGNDQVPQWPENATLSASDITQTGANLTWTPASDDAGVTDYKVYNTEDNSVAATVSGAVYNCTLNSLDAGTNYNFKVEAGDAAGNWSTGGPGTSVKTLAAVEQNTPLTEQPAEDTTAPFWTNATLTASNITQTGMTLAWTLASDDTDVVGYKVLMNGNELASVNGNSYEVTGLNAGTEYTFKVEAGDAAGLWSTTGPSTMATTLTAETTVLPLGVPSVVDTVNPMIFEGGIIVDLSKSPPTAGSTLTVTEVEQDVPGMKVAGKIVKLQFSYGFRSYVRLTLPLNEGVNISKASIFNGANNLTWRFTKLPTPWFTGDPGLELVDGINGGQALRAYIGNFPQKQGIGYFGIFEDTEGPSTDIYTMKLESIKSNEVGFSINTPVINNKVVTDPSGHIGCKVYRDGVLIEDYAYPDVASLYSQIVYYKDTTVQPGNTYRYSMQIVDCLGNVSDMLPEISVTIPAGDAATVAAVKAMDLITYADGDSASSVTQNLKTFRSGGIHPYDGVSVSWTSDHMEIIDPSQWGKVNKPSDADTVDVKLTATITCGSFSDTSEYNLTVRWTETSSISTFSEFTSALSRSVVKTIIQTDNLNGTGTFDCNNKTIKPVFSGYMFTPVAPSLNLGNLTVDGNNVSTITRAANVGNGKNINFDNITFQGTDGFEYLIYAVDTAAGLYDIVANNCRFSPVKNYAFFATTGISYKGISGYGKKLTLTGNTFAAGANIKIEAGIATLTNNTINSRIEILKGATINNVIINDAATAQAAADALLAANQITAPVDGSYGIIIYNTDGTVLYQAHKVDQPKPALVDASTDATGSKITVSFNMAMADPSSQKEQFAVLMNGNANPVTAVALNNDDSEKVDLTLTTPVVFGDVLKITYTPGTVASSLGGLLEGFTDISVVNNVPASIVEAPTANPSAGEVEADTAVSLATATAGASIYYTLDGTTPTRSSSLYETSIIINEAKTIKAIAVKNGMADSNVLTAAYTVKSSVITDARVSAYLCEINNDNTSTAGTVIVSSSTVPINPIIKLKFANNVVYNAASNISCVSLLDSNGQAVPNVDIYTIGNGDKSDPEKTNIFVQPKSPLTLSASYKIVVSPEVAFKNGLTLGEPAFEIAFTTVNQVAEITLIKATLSGSDLTLTGLPSAVNLEYRTVTGNVAGDWTALNYRGTVAMVDASNLNLVSGVSQVEVRVQGGSGATASKTVFIAVDGNQAKMENSVPLYFEDKVTVTPENMDAAKTNRVSLKRYTLPGEMEYHIGPVGFAYEVYLQGTGDSKKVTLSFPVDTSLNIDKMSVYTVDKSLDLTPDKSDPLHWQLQYLVPDRSKADQHMISVTATEVPEAGGTFVYEVFYDNTSPGPLGSTLPPIIDIDNKKIVFPRVEVYDNDRIEKIDVYRDGNMIGTIATLSKGSGEFTFEDADPALQIGQTYAYNFKAYDRMGNWSWATNVKPAQGEVANPTGDISVLFDSDANAVEKVRQALDNGTFSFTFASEDSVNHVVTDFQIPNLHYFLPAGVDLQWSSSDPSIIRIPPGYTAKVVKSADGSDKEVTVTATITRGDTTATVSWKLRVTWEPWAGGVMPVRCSDGTNGVRDTMYEFSRALNQDNINKIILVEGSPAAPNNVLDCKGKTLVVKSLPSNIIIKNAVIEASTEATGYLAIGQGTNDYVFENVEFKGGENLDSFIESRGGSLTLTNCRFGSTKVAPVSIVNYDAAWSVPTGIRIENCTFDGAGKPGYAVRYEKDGTLIAVNNTITGYHGTTSSGVPSAGFLIPSGQTVTLVGNKISNCDDGILVQTSSSANTTVNDIQITDIATAEGAGNALLESNELTAGVGPVVVINNVDSLFHPVVWYQAAADNVTISTGAPTWTAGSLMASKIDETELTLSWSGASDPVAVTGYRVYQGANLIATVPDTTFHVTNLLPDKTYQFRVEAGNAQNEWSLDGPTISVVTSPNTPPVWPEGSQVTVTEIGPNSALLSWTPATDKEGFHAYWVYVNGQSTHFWNLDCLNSEVFCDYNAKSLQPDTEYTFQIYAEDSLRVLSPGPSVKARTAAGQSTNWTEGRNRLAVSNLQSTGLTLNWTAPPPLHQPLEGVGMKEYKLLMNGVEKTTFPYMGDYIKDANTSNYCVTGLQPGTTYTFKLEVLEDRHNPAELHWTTDGPSIMVTTPAQGSHNGHIGQPLDIYLQGSTGWLNSINDVKMGGSYGVDGTSIKNLWVVEQGHIQIGADAFTEAKDYILSVSATGYPDVYLTQTITKSTTGEISPAPVLKLAEITNKGDISLTFDKEMANPSGTQGQFTVKINGSDVEISAVESTNTPEKIKLVLKTKATGANNVTIDYTKSSNPAKQLKSADGGIVESFNTQIGAALTSPPSLKKDTSDNLVGNSVDITFIDDAAWRNAISGVTIDSSSISGKYSVSAGKITIEAGLFTEARNYDVAVKATGYNDAGVTQKMHKVITKSSVAVDESNRNLAVTSTTPTTTVTIPEGVSDATINVGGLLNAPAGGEVETGALPGMNIAANTSIHNTPVQVQIPAGTTVSAPEGWDGTINVPTVQANNSVTVTPDSGKTATVKSVIEVGFGDVPLTFSKAVKLVLPGQAGKDAGYIRNGIFTPITSICTENSQAWADANIPAGGDGKVDAGQDLVIWTKHFTLFATYEQSVTGGSGGDNTGGGGTGGGEGSGTAGGLTVSFNKTKLSPTDTLLQFDFGNGMDKTVSSNLSKIRVYEKDTGSEVQYSNYNYIKQGQGDDAVKIRRLELMFNNLKSGMTYVVELAADIEANNGSTLGTKQSFEFTTTGTASAAGGAGGPAVEQGIGKDGGTINEYGTKIEIPAASFDQSIKVAVQIVADVSKLPMAAKSKLASNVIEITKDQDGNFTKAVTITINFDKSKVDTNMYDLSICYLNEKENKWIALDNVKVDLAAAKVSGEAKHFTKFAVIATEKAEASLPVGSGKLINLSDIQGHWAQQTIAELIALGAIGGYPDGTFKPDQGISRAEFASILVKALKLEPKQGKVFNDTAGHWAKDAIAAAAAYGIVNGYSDTSYGPDDSITREQMAVMMVKAAKLAEVKEGKVFADGNKVSAWAGNAVTTASQNKIINGYPDNTFRPQNKASRAEAATVIAKALKMAV
ncbi:MAG: S-layer homology domain-containing protein [Syntrophomonas sp.]